MYETVDLEQKISIFVENQFPDFYKEEGPAFIEFIRTYYEWMEQTGNILDLSENFAAYSDIDTTLDEFLSHFKEQYLFSIPETILTDKRFLVKHILDVYRSKGTIEGYKLLFRLLYNEDINIYLPSVDILKASDATWTESKFIEVSYSTFNRGLVGKSIFGNESDARALVEDFVTQVVNGKMINILYLSHISGEFEIDEYIVEEGLRGNAGNLAIYPKILGSMNSIDVFVGGAGFNIGDILSINGGSGVEGVVRVNSTRSSNGNIIFNILDGGEYYSLNAIPIITRESTNTIPLSGNGASFAIGALSTIKSVTYNTNLIAEDASDLISSDSTQTLADELTFVTKDFGTIASISQIVSGNNYKLSPTVAVRDLISCNLAGNVQFTTSSANVVGTGTAFTTYFSNNSYIQLSANNKSDHRIVKQVVNNTLIVLDDFPLIGSNSTNGTHALEVPVMRASFNEGSNPSVFAEDGSYQGENEVIIASALFGNNIINSTVVKNSGFGYVQDDIVDIRVQGTISAIQIANSGIGYANDEIVLSVGGTPTTIANAIIVTDGNGSITNTSIIRTGSGYKATPSLVIQTANGTGAVLLPIIADSEPVILTKGIVQKGAVGSLLGRFLTTDSFLNSNKYLQDGYYYQEFSYEIQSSKSLELYSTMLKKTFHLAGTELFGKVVALNENLMSSNAEYDITSIDGSYNVYDYE